MARTIEDAQHEAAHVVVGATLGLTLVSATIETQANGDLGVTVFLIGALDRYAYLLFVAAGLAWERRHGHESHASGDVACLRSAGVKGTRPVRILERAAWAILESQSGLHARVTRALLDRDITQADLREMARSRLK